MAWFDKFNKKDFEKELYKTSLDDENNDYLLDVKDNCGEYCFNEKVYSLDNIKKLICRKLRGCNEISSCDAMKVIGDDEYYIIEFKNHKYDRIDKNQIIKKAFDSITVLMNSLMEEKSISWLKNKCRLIVVYNDSKNDNKEKCGMSNVQEVYDIHKSISMLAKQKPKTESGDLGLSKIKNVLYKDIYVLDKNEFIARFFDCSNGCYVMK